MKKYRLIASVCVLSVLVTMLSGCGKAPASGGAETVEIPREGCLGWLDVEYDEWKTAEGSYPYSSLDCKLTGWTSYGSLNEMLLGLESGKVDFIYASMECMKYIQRGNPKLTLFVDTSVMYYYSMAVRVSDTGLYDKLNGALEEMDGDGTLNSLIDKYILNASDEQTESTPPHFDGAETVRVAVTGDLPPLDYISASGKPSGYNAAIIAELGRRMEVNFELVTVASDARAAALASERADVIFWINRSNPDAITTDTLRITRAYYSAYGAALLNDYPYEKLLEAFGVLATGR